MITEQGNSLLETRRKNRVLIKNSIFRKNVALRTDIARELNLTLPTITNSVKEMIEEGILEEDTPTEDLAVRSMGRKPKPVSFRRDAGYAIGIEAGPYNTRAVLINLRGEVLESITDQLASESYQLMLLQLQSLIAHLRKRIPDPEKLIGIGCGIPGFMDANRGIVLSNYREDWNGKNVAEDLSKIFGCPVCLDNNVRFRAIGYEMMQKDFRAGMFAYLFISRGVACPVFYGNDLLSGENTGAGELGQTILLHQVDGQETKDLTVDDIASEKAIQNQCEEEMRKGHLKALQERMKAGEPLGMRTILDLQMKGDPEIDRIIDRCIRYDGIATANVVNLLNPNLIVVDAFLMSNQKNRDRLVNYARKYFYGINEKDVTITFHSYDSYDGARGAALGSIQKLFLNS